jgi:hypothetical protein
MKRKVTARKLTGKETRVHDYVYKKLNLRNVRGLVKDTTGWDTATLDSAERWYRNYLWLAYRYRLSRQAVGIERHADQYWHAHIIDTEDYAKVCQTILGKRGFLHHKPVRKSVAVSPRLRAQTEAAYRKEFPDEFMEIRVVIEFDMPCFWHLIF